MSQLKGFIFDYAKCVGCHACMVACSNENGTKPPLSWRNVSHFNKEKLPLLGYVHLSLACNHCGEAPCKSACPSGAYTFDDETNAVIHIPELCLGCKYCTWACPFGAPQYNSEVGIIEKCHFCYHRLKEGKIPSCALNCPTGALSFGEIKEKSNPDTFGLSRKDIYPRITVHNADVVNSKPISDISATGVNSIDMQRHLQQVKSDLVNPFHEWPLAIFTLVGALLVGWVSALLMPNGLYLPLWLFALLAGGGMLLSALHLGKPLRSYLSVLNLKTSWLSREILLYGLFALFGFFSLLFDNNIQLIASSILGLTFLISVEMVYSITQKKFNTLIHSANTFAIALTFAAFFSQSWSVLLALLALRTMLFAVRTGTRSQIYNPAIAITAFFRMSLGFVIPFGFLAFTETTFNWVFTGSLIVGEVVDRFMFYGDFEPERPFSNDKLTG